MDLADIFRNLAEARNLTLSADADMAMVKMMKLIAKERGSQSDDVRIVGKILSLAIYHMNRRLEAMERDGTLPTAEQKNEIRPEDFKVKYASKQSLIIESSLFNERYGYPADLKNPDV